MDNAPQNKIKARDKRGESNEWSYTHLNFEMVESSLDIQNMGTILYK